MKSMLKKIFFFFAIVAAFLPRITIAMQPAALHGTIFNAYDNSIIRNASIFDLTGLNVIAFSGDYSLNVPPNNYSLIYTASGYAPNVFAGILAAPGTSKTIDVHLFPRPEPAFFIQGRVIALDSFMGIPSSMIIASAGGIAVTDNDGNFIIELPVSTRSITVLAQDYFSYEFKLRAELIAAKRKTNIFLSRAGSSNISVNYQIVDSHTGGALQSARIITTATEISHKGNGSFAIRMPVDGLASILSTAPGYQNCLNNRKFTSSDNGSLVRVELIPSINNCGLVSGLVRDSLTGKILEKVLIKSDSGFETQTQLSGNYKLYTSTCTRLITASKNGYVSQTISFAVQHGFNATLNLFLMPSGIVSGMITNSINGSPVCKADLFIDNATQAAAQSDSDGFYHIEDIPAGVHSLRAVHDCYQETTADISISPHLEHHESFVLESAANGIVKGMILNSLTGSPVAEAIIHAEHCAETKSLNDGTYELALPACPTNLYVKSKAFLLKTFNDVVVNDNQTFALNVQLLPCPFVAALASFEPHLAQEMLSTFRKFRDDVLLPRFELRWITKLYYNHADEISDLILNNPLLLKATQNLLVFLYTQINNNIQTSNHFSP